MQHQIKSHRDLGSQQSSASAGYQDISLGSRIITVVKRLPNKHMSLSAWIIVNNVTRVPTVSILTSLQRKSLSNYIPILQTIYRDLYRFPHINSKTNKSLSIPNVPQTMHRYPNRINRHLYKVFCINTTAQNHNVSQTTLLGFTLSYSVIYTC